MKRLLRLYCLLTILHCNASNVYAQDSFNDELEKNFKNPPAQARPWVFWYWMHAAVSKEGITADLEAMKETGIGGAYLMPIKDTSAAIPFQPTARQLSPGWWKLVQFAMQEAKRLDLKLAMHVSDGFALAGGPWITPELSMQKLVWTKTIIKGDHKIQLQLQEPEAKANYYEDIAVFAYPVQSAELLSDKTIVPSVSASDGTSPSFLSIANSASQSFKSDTACWIQYKYAESFTARSVRIHVGGNNYQAQRLIVQASNDGIIFKTITRLEPPRHGWQDTDEDVTHALPETTAKYFRFVYDKEGSEPGAEDLDAAKWKPSFKVMGIYLSATPVIHQFESKNGSVWRVSKRTSIQQVPDRLVVPMEDIIDISDKMDAKGKLIWDPPAGKTGWMIVRIGHTSTGHTNATGGGGRGLECDKFNPAAVQLQFSNWFAQAFVKRDSGGEKTDFALAKDVLKIFHVDSWECGSQNWSATFSKEFRKRRGYEIKPYLLAMTGVPIESLAASEKFLHDVRQTIAELVNDVFYGTLKQLAHEKGCSFSAESVAPTMVSDGLLHYKNTDLPMGEFWLNSPTHDKPNDMHDAISGAHIYGKNIIQAEAFTSVRMNWGEHPGNLKVLGDRNFALGINKMVLHVFTHNPWLDRKPGMTLDGVGLYFQRDQVWFKQSKAWIDYLARCQTLLQMGKPVVDIAVFTGEEIPRRSVLPDRLVSTLPGIFGKQRVQAEKKRLQNESQPLRQIPDGVRHSANMADPEDWIDPLNGYAYDSFNPDALAMATVKNGRIVLPGGASYAILIFPGQHPMQPNKGMMSESVAKKLIQLANDGAIIVMSEEYTHLAGLKMKSNKSSTRHLIRSTGKSKIVRAPYNQSSFNQLGLERDVEIINNNHTVAWAHRKTEGADIYFISNQLDRAQEVSMSFRVEGMVPQTWDPVSSKIVQLTKWAKQKGRTNITLRLHANQSVFIVFRKTISKTQPMVANRSVATIKDISNNWSVKFDTGYGGPVDPVLMEKLKSWPELANPAAKYYSGTAVYSNKFIWEKTSGATTIEIDSIYNIATVKLNGIDCGTIWTKPYSLDITKALKHGENKIEIEVSNTWHNRLIGDSLLPPGERVTWTTAPFRLKNKPLLPAGLIGKVKIVTR